MTLEPDITEALLFLHLLAPHGATPQAAAFSFQTVDDKRLKNGKPRDDKKLSQTLHGTLAQHAPHLTRLNVKFGAAIYVTINETDGKGRKAENILRIRAVWADLDKGLPQHWQLPPSIIVETSPGKFQAYWLVTGLSQADHIGILRHIALTYGADMGVLTVERILRVPGFYHQKGAPFRVRIVEANGRRYTADELTAVHPPMIEERKKAETLPAVIVEDTRNRTLASAAGTMRRRGFPVETIEVALHDLNMRACNPPLAAKEVEKIARSSGKYPAGSLVKEGEVKWPEADEDGIPHKSAVNVAAFLQHIGAIVYKDEFNATYHIDGFDNFTKLNDEAIRALYVLAENYRLRPRKEMFTDYVLELARQDTRHPVREYHMGLTWDARPRIGTWLVDYMGAEDTPLHRQQGVIILLAAVARIHHPGCKFDHMPVFEGPQDLGKSSVWRELAGDQWFSDDLRLGAEAKVIIEQTRGRWIIEHAELEGMGKREIETVKAMITRREDSARLAYGRFSESVPRQFILVATTNDATYLRDETGNRRFWPIKCTKADWRAIRRDRDQLWAETVHIANRGAIDLYLPDELKPAAIAAQTMRQIGSPIEDGLVPLLHRIDRGFVLITDLLTALGIRNLDERHRHYQQLGKIMQKLGWQKLKRRDKGVPRWGYWIGAKDALLYIWNPGLGEFVIDPEHPASKFLQ